MVNLEHIQGKDWLGELTLTDENGAPIDLTGCSFRGQARSAYDSTHAAFSYVFTPKIPLTDGKCDVSLPNNFYTKIISSEAKFVYDWEFVSSGGLVDELQRGIATVLPEATK